MVIPYFSEEQIKNTFTPFQTACLTLACLSSVISFAALADTKSYTDASAYQFTVVAGVSTWVWSVLVLFTPSFNVMGITFPIEDLETTVRQGNIWMALISYTAAVACQSISSDIDEAIFDDEEDSGRVCKDGFCSKVYVACTFIWFAAGSMILAVADKESCILDEIGITTPQMLNDPSYVSNSMDSVNHGGQPYEGNKAGGG